MESFSYSTFEASGRHTAWCKVGNTCWFRRRSETCVPSSAVRDDRRSSDVA